MSGRHRRLFAVCLSVSLPVVLVGCGGAVSPAAAGVQTVTSASASAPEPMATSAAEATAAPAATATALPPQPTTAPTATTIAPAADVVAVSAVADDLAPLSDEFDDPTSLQDWQDLNQVEEFPTRIELVDVNTTSPGHLYLVPFRSSWFEDYRGVYFYKTITGDFDVTTRIQTTGKSSDLPSLSFSLAGLMARAPRDITMQTWEPEQENWIFITTGYGDAAPRRAGKPQIETKTTTNSRSNLQLILSRTGWVDLRIVRIGPTFLMMYRFPDTSWTVSRRFFRTNLPETLQVGLNAYSSGGDGLEADAYNRVTQNRPGDLIVRSDYIRFRRPTVSESVKAQVAENELPFSELLPMLGE